LKLCQHLQTSAAAQRATALKAGYNRPGLQQIQCPGLVLWLGRLTGFFITANESSLETAQRLKDGQWRCY